MRKYKSQTVNGGQTIILPSLDEAIKLGRDRCALLVGHFQKLDPAKEVEVTYMTRDPLGKGDKKKPAGEKRTNGSLLESWKDFQEQFEECVGAITKGHKESKERISDLIDKLVEMASELAPSLKANYAGFDRSDEGVDASPDLIAAGEEMCCFKRKEGAENIKQGSGEGAYRIIINTDHNRDGSAFYNCGITGALVILLQRFKPVEVWIQQGWMSHEGSGINDGVTLFKLDFGSSFDPTALEFWTGHPGKDWTFSYAINMELGRVGTGTSKNAEIECDLMLRGDMMLDFGINEHEFLKKMHTEKMDIMAEWIAATTIKLAFNQQPEEPTITG